MQFNNLKRKQTFARGPHPCNLCERELKSKKKKAKTMNPFTLYSVNKREERRKRTMCVANGNKEKTYTHPPTNA